VKGAERFMAGSAPSKMLINLVNILVQLSDIWWQFGKQLSLALSSQLILLHGVEFKI
jgi:hypothetical protein